MRFVHHSDSPNVLMAQSIQIVPETYQMQYLLSVVDLFLPVSVPQHAAGL